MGRHIVFLLESLEEHFLATKDGHIPWPVALPIFKASNHITQISASVIISSLILILLFPSYKDPCYYIGCT